MKITLGEKRVATVERVVSPNEVAHGPGWIVLRQDAELQLRYQSAGHGASDEALSINATELSALQSDPNALDTILRQHGR